MSRSSRIAVGLVILAGLLIALSPNPSIVLATVGVAGAAIVLVLVAQKTLGYAVGKLGNAFRFTWKSFVEGVPSGDRLIQWRTSLKYPSSRWHYTCLLMFSNPYVEWIGGEIAILVAILLPFSFVALIICAASQL